MSIESVLLERLLGEVAKLTQPQFADESNTQRCVRTQTRLAPPVILHDKRVSITSRISTAPGNCPFSP
jgi:hypothetical protein